MDVDPSAKALDQGVRALRLVKIDGALIEVKSGKNAGKETFKIDASFTVINDDNYAGRRLWHSFWLSNPYNQKELRKLADSTGVVQEAGEPLAAWLAKLTEFQPEFKTFVGVEEYDKGDGSKGQKNVINFFQATPIN